MAAFGALSQFYRDHVPEEALVAKGKAPWVLFRTYVTDQTKRVDELFSPSPEFLLDFAWATMEMTVAMIPRKRGAAVATAMLELWTARPEGAYYGHKGMQSYLADKLGMAVAGDVMMARTNPSQRQQMAVRRKLLKMIFLMHELQQVLLETAQRHRTAVMPGYTHVRHAQPTTLGHYLLSVHDPLARAMQTLENGCHAMALNELGCGALAGTSWPVDRDLVSDYLGLEGLIENTNDAVSYSDGYALVTTAAATIMSVMSRMAQELEYWSTLEYDFLDFAIGAGSFMMPNKRSNQGILERTAEGASKALGALTEIVSMGMKVPHGDVQPMAYCMAEGTLRALEQLDRYMEPYLYFLPTMIVHEERMLEVARRGYSCSTELANELVRSFELDYRTAHEVVNRFVTESAAQGIPPTRASIDIFLSTAHDVTGQHIDMTESRLRDLLDPVHFVKVTRSRGGVAPEEVERMIQQRWQDLQEARQRHVDRLDRIEKGRTRMLQDLTRFAGQHDAPDPNP